MKSPSFYCAPMAPKLAKPNIPSNIGDVTNPIIANIIPTILHTICFFSIPMTPKISANGTNSGEKIKILISPKINDAIPSAFYSFFCYAEQLICHLKTYFHIQIMTAWIWTIWTI